MVSLSVAKHNLVGYGGYLFK